MNVLTGGSSKIEPSLVPVFGSKNLSYRKTHKLEVIT
jgi:hypothetical protein